MRPLTSLRACLALAALAFGLAAAPASAVIPGPLSQWNKLSGLNAASGAQWVRALAYGTPPNIVYAGLEGGGVFRSVTGGATWSACNGGFPNPLTTNVRALLTSSTGTTAYAGTDSGIWKTSGCTWEPLAQGPEDNPANPKKLNQSVQSLLSGTVPGVMLAGVFSGGVYKSTDGGNTWSPPPANSGMPASETIYGLTESVPGLIYATGGSGVYVSVNQGSTWTRVSDGIPGSASPITTWAYPQRPDILFTSTGSNGIYRSTTAGLTWSEINDGLGAVRARGLQIFTAAKGAHVYAGTENGVWESLTPNTPIIAAKPKWRQVTTDGLIEPGASNLIMWSLTAPVIPGAGALGLITGTQSNGGYFLAFEPPDSPCPSSPNTTTDCPRLSDTTPEVGTTLSALNGKWTGTKIIEFAYQWQRCTTSSGGCSDIQDAEESSYVVCEADQGKYLRVRITATNPAPTFDLVQRFSTISGQVAASPTTRPGYNQIYPPGITNLTGSTFSPEVGDVMSIVPGTTPNLFNDGYFNPKSATAFSYRWLRCESASNCNEIPSATNSTYKLTPADGTKTVKVRVRGSANNLATVLESGESYYIISQPAAVAPPIPNPDGGAPISQDPRIIGNAIVGETIVGDVGGWVDPTTSFRRRWLRCDGGGASCTVINRPASVDPETGSTYIVRPEDVGATIRLRVTADVNNDLAGDDTDNTLPKATEIETPPTAVVAFPPAPAGAGGPSGGASGSSGPASGGPAPDVVKPAVLGATLSKPSFKAGGKGTVFRFRLSERANVSILISRARTGRLVKGRCAKPTRRNRRAKRCRYQQTVATLRRAGVPAGDVAIRFTGKVKGRKLAPGRYTARIVATDASGNVGVTTLTFRIVRR